MVNLWAVFVLCSACLLACASASDPRSDASGFVPGLDLIWSQLLEEVEDETCRRDGRELLEASFRLESWALKMIDASAKLQSGVLDGNIKNLGQFDECVSADTPPRFSGQYCLADVQLDAMPGHPRREVLERLLNQATLGRRDREININRTNIPVPDLLPSLSLVQMGVCVPSSCSAHDVQLTLSAALQWLTRPAGLVASAQLLPGSCSVLREQPWTAAEIAMIILVALLTLLVVAGSALDSPSRSKEGGLTHLVLRCFSLKANWGRLMQTATPTPTTFTALDGLRVLSTLWVVLAHKIFYILQEPWVNKSTLVQSLSSVSKMPLVNNMASVETFLLASGLLRAHSLACGRHRGSFLTDAVKRYLRLTPAYVFMIMFYSTMLPRLGSGPRWNHAVEHPAAACQSQWPLNLLYLNNYLHGGQHCMIQTWYLAADMQLFLLAPLLLVPVWRLPHRATSLLVLMVFVATAIPLVYTLNTGALPTYLPGASNEQNLHYQSSVHFATHRRAASYVVGVALGLVLARQDAPPKLSRTAVAAGWSLCLVLLYDVVFAAFPFMQIDYKYRPLEMALYGALHRPAWAVALAWIVFACHTGYGGWINGLLSARVFQPLSRLSYCIFLTHYVVLMVGTGRLRTAIYVDEYELVRGLVADIFVTLLAATCLHLLVEAPLLAVFNQIPFRSVPETTTIAIVTPRQNQKEETFSVMKSTEEPVVKSKLV